LERRELQIIDSLIGNMKMMEELFAEVVDECLLESVNDYVVENLMNKMTK